MRILVIEDERTLGGHICAESTPGHGATFRLELLGYRRHGMAVNL
jgi:signal transduction histidine kinase